MEHISISAEMLLPLRVCYYRAKLLKLECFHLTREINTGILRSITLSFYCFFLFTLQLYRILR